MGFILTKGMSLAEWDDIGMLSREIEPYNILAGYFNKIYIFTYGDKKELEYKKYLKPNIEIIHKSINVSDNKYSFLLPLFHFKIIKELTFLKTNQMRGAEALISAKILNKRIKLIARTGYAYSLFARRQGNYGKKIHFLEKIIYKICDAAIVSSEGDKNYLLSEYNSENSKITVMRNYINTEIFKPVEKIKKHENRIIFVGRITEQKNLFSLAAALQDTGIALDIIGNGRLRQKLHDFAKKINIEINFLGNFPNDKLPYILNRYKIFVLPSLYEGMPKTLLEAMSCRLAVIGTNVSGTKEIIDDHETGILSQTDAADLKKQILALMADERLRTHLGKNARQFIINSHNLLKNINMEINIYEKIAEKMQDGKKL